MDFNSVYLKIVLSGFLLLSPFLCCRKILRVEMRSEGQDNRERRKSDMDDKGSEVQYARGLSADKSPG